MVGWLVGIPRVDFDSGLVGTFHETCMHIGCGSIFRDRHLHLHSAPIPNLDMTSPCIGPSYYYESKVLAWLRDASRTGMALNTRTEHMSVNYTVSHNLQKP